MKPIEVTIRAAVSTDAKALTDLVYRSKQSNGYSDATMALFAADDALRITATRLATQRFWIAQKGDVILGCVALDPHEGTVGEIRTFFIAPEHKRQGIGKRLWRAVVTIALTQGFSRLTICIDPNTLPFFEALGFTIQEMRESSCIKGRMTPVMFRDI